MDGKEIIKGEVMDTILFIQIGVGIYLVLVGLERIERRIQDLMKDIK